MKRVVERPGPGIFTEQGKCDAPSAERLTGCVRTQKVPLATHTHGYDSALPGCHESRGTRYSERHSERRRRGLRAVIAALSARNLPGSPRGRVT